MFRLKRLLNSKLQKLVIYRSMFDVNVFGGLQLAQGFIIQLSGETQAFHADGNSVIPENIIVLVCKNQLIRTINY